MNVWAETNVMIKGRRLFEKKKGKSKNGMQTKKRQGAELYEKRKKRI